MAERLPERPLHALREHIFLLLVGRNPEQLVCFLFQHVLGHEEVKHSLPLAWYVARCVDMVVQALGVCDQAAFMAKLGPPVL